jgi:hypothetical protein
MSLQQEPEERPTMAAAAERVLATYELIEPILFNLPTKDLLLAQRVCTKWKSVIEQSTMLQQALFFKRIPGTTPFVVGYPELVQAKFFINPLLERSPMARLEGQYEVGSTFLQSSTGSTILPSKFLDDRASWRKM